MRRINSLKLSSALRPTCGPSPVGLAASILSCSPASLTAATTSTAHQLCSCRWMSTERGSGGNKPEGGKKSAAETAPAASAADDDLSLDEDLTAAPPAPVRQPQQRTPPKPGSAKAYKQPRFAAESASASERATLNRAFSEADRDGEGPDAAGEGGAVDEDIAAIESDLARLSRLTGQAAAAASTSFRPAAGRRSPAGAATVPLSLPIGEVPVLGLEAEDGLGDDIDIDEAEIDDELAAAEDGEEEYDEASPIRNRPAPSGSSTSSGPSTSSSSPSSASSMFAGLLDGASAADATREYEAMAALLKQNKARAAGSVFSTAAPGMSSLGSGLQDQEESEMVSQAMQAAAAQGPALPGEGLAIDYCIFCYHGTHGLLSHDNMALLTMFVSERGFILPKRFTKCCAKHQRKLARTIRRARWMNLIPWHSKLHPKLRFHSLKPEQVQQATGVAVAAAAAGLPKAPAAARVVSTATGTATKKVVGAGASSLLGGSSLDKRGIQEAVADLEALTAGNSNPGEQSPAGTAGAPLR